MTTETVKGTPFANYMAGIAWQPAFIHAARTAIAAVVSFLAARLLGMPEAYWAPLTTMVITQSSLGAALKVSGERFMGTILGAMVGAIAASVLGAHGDNALRVAVFGGSIFLLGLICAAIHSDHSAYRFGGVTVAVVLLVPRAGPAWRIAFHRFVEVSIGIGIALILTRIWPDKEEVEST